MNRNLRARELAGSILTMRGQLLLRRREVDALLADGVDSRARGVVCWLWLGLRVAVLRRVLLGAVRRRCVALVLGLASVLLRLASCVWRDGGLAWVGVVWCLLVAAFELDGV
jgi:hypothetical protein